MTSHELMEAVTPVIKANEISMQAAVDDRSYLIVEGKSDFRLFNKILSVEDWEVEYLEGKHNVTRCIEQLDENGVLKAIAVLDSDPYDPCQTDAPVVYSSYADLDADIFAVEGMIDRIIGANSNIRDQTVLRTLGADSWHELILELVTPWTALREFTSTSGNSVSMTDIPISRIANAHNGKIDVEKITSHLVQRSGGRLSEDELRIALEQSTNIKYDDKHNGHHLAHAIAWVIAEVLKSEKMKPTTIEDLARTSIQFSELRSLPVLQSIDAWAHQFSICIWQDPGCVEIYEPRRKS